MRVLWMLVRHPLAVWRMARAMRAGEDKRRAGRP